MHSDFHPQNQGRKTYQENEEQLSDEAGFAQATHDQARGNKCFLCNLK